LFFDSAFLQTSQCLFTMLPTLFVLSTITNTALSRRPDGTYYSDDLPDAWHRPGTCYNLEEECLRGQFRSEEQCYFCWDDCEKGDEYDPSWCGDIDRSDCDRVEAEAAMLCESYNTQCVYDINNKFIEGNKCKMCFDECPYWKSQCELKMYYDLNGGSHSINASVCVNFTAWPNPGAGPCCSTLVHEEKIEQCAINVLDACEDMCYDMAHSGDYDGMFLCLDKCRCYFNTTCGDFPNECNTRETCEAISARTDSFNLRMTEASLEMTGAILIIKALLCIAAVLCCVICVQWRKQKEGKYEGVDMYEENEKE